MIAVLTVALAGGCTVQRPGSPEPASTSKSSDSLTPQNGDLPTDGAPKVDNPVDVSHFEQNPCDALTAEDAKTLNVPATGEQSNGGVGETCSWRNSETRGSLSITFFSEFREGLSSVYREAKTAGWSYFERINDVEGHPAVAFNRAEEKPKYECSAVVGVTDQLVFTTRVAISDANVGKRDPCEAATQAAGMMMRTMREAA